MKEIRILGLHLTNRVKEAIKVQDVLTKFGCSIKTRLGLHDVNEEVCSTNGIIILELCGSIDEMAKLENELLKIEGLEVRKMTF
jgi:hypothetical protein